MLYVAVIGKGTACPKPVRHLAQQAGHYLARLHPQVALITGGIDGVMDAAAHGMTLAGGTAIGLIPETGRAPSAHLTHAIRLGLPPNHRNIVMGTAADAMIVLPGSHGTLIEGWSAADRGLPLIALGDHEGHPTASLPFRTAATPAELPGLLTGLLDLEHA